MAARVQQSPSWSLKTRCRELTVLDYIRLVCEGDLSVLVASGKPLDKELEAARADILAELGELSGGGKSEARSLHDAIEAYRADIFAATTALSIFEGVFDDELRERACKVLDACGIDTRAWGKEITEANIKRAIAEIKAKNSRLELKVKEYSQMAAKNEGKAVTEADIRLEMVILSADLSHSIADDCNLATYAAYRKAHKERVKALEIMNSKRK
jgi:hypothetical protein